MDIRTACRCGGGATRRLYTTPVLLIQPWFWHFSLRLPFPVLHEAKAQLRWGGGGGEDAIYAAVSRVVLWCTLCCRVLQSVVLLSDSQLHLFLQSQLSVPEIEACVQGRGSMTVSDAILSYAMSNCGWAQEERQSSSHLAKGDQLNR